MPRRPAKGFAAAHTSFVSSAVATESDGQLGFNKAIVADDRDGHAIVVEQK